MNIVFIIILLPSIVEAFATTRSPRTPIRLLASAPTAFGKAKDQGKNKAKIPAKPITNTSIRSADSAELSNTIAKENKSLVTLSILLSGLIPFLTLGYGMKLMETNRASDRTYNEETLAQANRRNDLLLEQAIERNAMLLARSNERDDGWKERAIERDAALLRETRQYDAALLARANERDIDKEIFLLDLEEINAKSDAAKQVIRKRIQQLQASRPVPSLPFDSSPKQLMTTTLVPAHMPRDANPPEIQLVVASEIEADGTE